MQSRNQETKLIPISLCQIVTESTFFNKWK